MTNELRKCFEKCLKCENLGIWQDDDYDFSIECEIHEPFYKLNCKQFKEVQKMTYEIKEYDSCYELIKNCKNKEGYEYQPIIAHIWFDPKFDSDRLSKNKAYEIVKEIKNHLELNNQRENEINYLQSIEERKHSSTYKPPSNSKRKYGVTKKDKERWKKQLFNKHIN